MGYCLIAKERNGSRKSFWKRTGPCKDMGGTRRTSMSLRKLVRLTKLHTMRFDDRATRQQGDVRTRRNKSGRTAKVSQEVMSE